MAAHSTGAANWEHPICGGRAACAAWRRMRVKICGIRRVEDALAAVEAGRMPWAAWSGLDYAAPTASIRRRRERSSPRFRRSWPACW